MPESPTPTVYFPRLTAEAESTLRASDAIIAISADAIISTDAHQRIIRFNRGAEEIFGYTAEEVIGRPLDILLPPRFRGAHTEHVRRFGQSSVAARRMGERRQIAGVRKTGEEFPAEASISRLEISGETIFTVVLRDVTERRRAEQSQRFLSQAGALLARSLEPEETLDSVAALAVPTLGNWCVVFLKDPKLRRAIAVHTNPECAPIMQRLRELPFSQLPTHPATIALERGEPVINTDITDELLAAMEHDEEYLQLMRKLAPRSTIAVPLQARDRTMGAIMFFFDAATGRVHTREDLELAQELARRAALALDNARLYAEAQQAIRARDDVLAVVSHDLGNPLSAIRLGTTLLLRRIPEEERESGGWKHLENIRASVAQMERLIRDLLEIKRIEAGYFALERERVSVQAILTEARETFEPVAAGRELRLEQRVPDDQLYVFADRERVLQVFSNLVGNAAKFTPAGGTISLEAEQKAGAVLFSVFDSGPGIPADHIPHVFDRFWQARRTGRQGIGLGLAIVKGIVEAHGGSVWVESEPGVGSVFRFSIPLADQDPAEPLRPR
jgi:PAS domain S-box-containing protein